MYLIPGSIAGLMQNSQLVLPLRGFAAHNKAVVGNHSKQAGISLPADTNPSIPKQ